jgi:hypothetical protein
LLLWDSRLVFKQKEVAESLASMMKGYPYKEGKTNVTVETSSSKEAEECLQWAAGQSSGLSTYFFEYSNRGPELRQGEPIWLLKA